MQKTLGGDRLGSGKKQKVHLHNYERSTHDLSYLWRSTMSAGTLVPFMSQVALPGDTFDINLHLDVKTHPTTGPIFGSFKAQVDIFVCPIRLYIRALHNNKLGIGMNMSQVKLPFVKLTAPAYDWDNVDPTADLDNSQINPSCILAYLGYRGIGMPQDGSVNKNRDFNALPILSYWDIYKNYYANKQEEEGVFIHTPVTGQTQNVVEIIAYNSLFNDVLPQNTPGAPAVLLDVTATIGVDVSATQDYSQVLIGTTGGEIPVSEFGQLLSVVGTIHTYQYNVSRWGTRIATYWRYTTVDEITSREIQLKRFPLSNIDDMRENILGASNAVPFNIYTGALSPYYDLDEHNGENYARLHSQEGLGVKTYQSDLFNNWLSTEWIDGTDGISEITAIDTTGGSFTIDTLLISRKVYDMLNRIAVSGGSFDDWMDAVYTEERYKKAETPMYMGGLIKELVFQEVVSNSTSAVGQDQGEQPLGTLAGKGTMSSKHKGGNVTIKVDEPSYIIGIVSLTPRIDYSQGNNWDIHLQTMDDLHKPQLDEIGFQELITEQMAWWSTHQSGVDSDEWTTYSAGKQPAWINYMTNVNKTYGNFAIKDNEMFMVLNRRYTPAWAEPQIEIDDLTTYIDPAKFNYSFAQTSLDSQNFWAQLAVNITARRKMSAKVMPNL